MKFLTQVIFLMSIVGSSSSWGQDFSEFLNELKLAAEQKNVEYFYNLYSKEYRRAAVYLGQPPNLSEGERFLSNAKWLMTQRVSNSEVLRYENETIKESGGILQWSRQAIYSEKADDYDDIEIDFVLIDGKFKLAPHFSHPTQEQLDNLEKMQARYQLYFFMDNVSDYDVFINGKQQIIINKNAHVMSLFDVQQGDNSIYFKFKKEDASLPIKFSASISFIERGTQQRFTEEDKVIDLYAKALSGEDVFGRLKISDDFLKDVEGDEISFNIKMQ